MWVSAFGPAVVEVVDDAWDLGLFDVGVLVLVPGFGEQCAEHVSLFEYVKCLA